MLLAHPINWILDKQFTVLYQSYVISNNQLKIIKFHYFFKHINIFTNTINNAIVNKYSVYSVNIICINIICMSNSFTDVLTEYCEAT